MDVPVFATGFYEKSGFRPADLATLTFDSRWPDLPAASSAKTGFIKAA